LDDSLKGELGLVSNEGLQRIFEIKELDYLTHIVFRMYENTSVRKTLLCSLVLS
jgi:inositol hexakisphosphate/diphosphoinositol-pentakisphosphate kinase